jgi:hypothetical protein
MSKSNLIINSQNQIFLEDTVVKYQEAVQSNDRHKVEELYKKITFYYNPLDYSEAWYDQYKYLFDSHDDFISDYLRVFATVLLGWKPRNKRKKSRYDGSGEFKNYFIGSLYHNYVNMIKADQAAKRNITKQCPICSKWVNPISTHLISEHIELLWDYLDEMSIDIDNLSSCPFCTNFKIGKNIEKEKIPDLIKSHFASKHSSFLFNKFNELYPDISTISPKIISTNIAENDDELDIYEVTEDKSTIVSKLFNLGLSEVQQSIVDSILNGELNLVFKTEKYKCTKSEWDEALEGLKEIISIYGNY